MASFSFDEGHGSVVVRRVGQRNNERSNPRPGRRWLLMQVNSNFNGTNADVRVADSASLHHERDDARSVVEPRSLSLSRRADPVKEQPNELVYGLYANSESGRTGRYRLQRREDRVQHRGLPVGQWSFLSATDSLGRGSLSTSMGRPSARRRRVRSMPASNGALRIGGDSVWADGSTGGSMTFLGHNRALSAAQIAADQLAAVTSGSTPADTTAPSQPTGVAVKSTTSSSVSLSWSASSYNVGVSGYGVIRVARVSVRRRRRRTR